MVEKSKMRLSGVPFFENTSKNFKFNLVLVLVLVLKSKSLYLKKCKEITQENWYLDIRLIGLTSL